jgi:hypothetical protein
VGAEKGTVAETHVVAAAGVGAAAVVEARAAALVVILEAVAVVAPPIPAFLVAFIYHCEPEKGAVAEAEVVAPAEV